MKNKTLGEDLFEKIILGTLLVVSFIQMVRILINPGYFHSDDVNLLLRGKYLYSGLGPADFTNFNGFMYRPLRDEFSYLIVNKLGENAFLIHLVSVLIALLSCLIFYFILLSLNYQKRRAYFAALLVLCFASSSYAIGLFNALADPLVVFFLLLIILLSLIQVKSKFFMVVIYSLVGMLDFFALITKEYAIIAPGLLVGIFLLTKRRILIPLIVCAVLDLLYMRLRWSGIFSVSDTANNYHIHPTFLNVSKNILKILVFNFVPSYQFLPNLLNVGLGISIVIGISGLLAFLGYALYSLKSFSRILSFLFCLMVFVSPILILQTPEEHQMYFLCYFFAALIALVPLAEVSGKIFLCTCLTLVLLAGLEHSNYVLNRGKFFKHSVQSFHTLELKQFGMNTLPRIKPKDIYSSSPELTNSESFPIYVTDNLCLTSFRGESRYWLKEIFDGRTEITPDFIFQSPIEVIIAPTEVHSFKRCKKFSVTTAGYIEGVNSED